MPTHSFLALISCYILTINLLAYIVYGVDKWKACKGKWRISEKFLLTLAALGGAFGARVAMSHFRHKTLHKKFTLLVPLFLFIWTGALLYIVIRYSA